ncbi:MAG: SMC-Scp complex subunit ScpB [Corynebacterium sp.]|nr:SMC-Scp complex subunit ScpB [Corynebacterium sp.]
MPDIAGIAPLRANLEAVLFVADRPLSLSELTRIVEADNEATVASMLEIISQEYSSRGSGIQLRHTNEGWRWYTAKAQAPAVERYVLDGAQTKLSRAALETLAVIAYRQPATRAQVAAVRGVNVDGVMRTLVQRGLIREAGTETSGAHLYETTQLFLELLGIDSLDALPNLAPLLPDIESIEDFI